MASVVVVVAVVVVAAVVAVVVVVVVVAVVAVAVAGRLTLQLARMPAAPASTRTPPMAKRRRSMLR